LGGLLALAAAERRPVGGLVLISPELPGELRMPARPYELREVGEVYGKDRIGWEMLSERLQRDNNDLTLDDVRRIQHMLGQKPHESGRSRRQVLLGIPVRREALADIPTLVIGGGLDRLVPEPGSERLADWLGAGYEPFGAHSHFGLVAGEHSFVQVADAVRTFLETNRL
jgi:pimeloyl-ACP methyl ester carboxylesterase